MAAGWAAPLEFRTSSVASVNFAQRVIEFIAVPYEEEALVEYRGEMWIESFLRGWGDGIERQPGRVKANRDHDGRRRTAQPAESFLPIRLCPRVGPLPSNPVQDEVGRSFSRITG